MVSCQIMGMSDACRNIILFSLVRTGVPMLIFNFGGRVSHLSDINKMNLYSLSFYQTQGNKQCLHQCCYVFRIHLFCMKVDFLACSVFTFFQKSHVGVLIRQLRILIKIQSSLVDVLFLFIQHISQSISTGYKTPFGVLLYPSNYISRCVGIWFNFI